MDININSEAMTTLVSKALVDMLTPEKREELITEAIKSLLVKKKTTSRYGSEDKSELQDIFEKAAWEATHAMVRDQLKDSADFRAKIEGVFRDAVAHAFAEENREKMVTKVGNAIVEGLKLDRY